MNATQTHKTAINALKNSITEVDNLSVDDLKDKVYAIIQAQRDTVTRDSNNADMICSLSTIRHQLTTLLDAFNEKKEGVVNELSNIKDQLSESY